MEIWIKCNEEDCEYNNDGECDMEEITVNIIADVCLSKE